MLTPDPSNFNVENYKNVKLKEIKKNQEENDYFVSFFSLCTLTEVRMRLQMDDCGIDQLR